MGSPCLFTRQQALKMGYFYWLRAKSLNHLHTELNLGYERHKVLSWKQSFIYWHKQLFRRYEILQLSQIRNENAATKRTVFSPNSATTKRQLISSTTDSNIN